jgi:hypothetical protein
LVLTQAFASDGGEYACKVQDDCASRLTKPAGIAVLPAGSADGNGDGNVDGRDVQVFVDALVNFAPVSPVLCAYELNGDGVVNVDDVGPFVVRLLQD